MDERKDLIALSHALRRLHQSLVGVARREYEAEWGEVDPGQLLQLLTKHPGFEWLRELSGLMTYIDELTDQESIGAEEAQAAHGAARKLLLPGSDTAQPGPFTLRYRDILQAEPLVVMEHAAVRKLLDRS
ncbi:hypothetical protein [Noviherbaspirillum aerium]|uniref:hypothetical protein n=1 Tax=Noviherbaspirillum aerium TaxID=2588497 RepID=UPI00124F42AF|nr:hypothetical protein [Noviherbaspirillum aerium]